jgi:hypothetical protein
LLFDFFKIAHVFFFLVYFFNSALSSCELYALYGRVWVFFFSRYGGAVVCRLNAIKKDNCSSAVENHQQYEIFLRQPIHYGASITNNSLLFFFVSHTLAC